MGRARSYIENDPNYFRFITHHPDSQDSEGLFDPAHSPLIGYRYVYHPEDYEHRRGEEFRYQNDCAFLPFRANKRDEVEILQRDLRDYNTYRQNELKETSYEELEAYHLDQTDIAVQKYHGKLDPSVDFQEDEENGNGISLRFVLDENW